MPRDRRTVLVRVLAGDVHAAERRHVKLMETTEGLPARPFLGGTSLDVDRALTEIAVFSAMVSCLPRGPGSLILDLGAGACWRRRSAGSPTAHYSLHGAAGCLALRARLVARSR